MEASQRHGQKDRGWILCPERSGDQKKLYKIIESILIASWDVESLKPYTHSSCFFKPSFGQES